MSYFKLIALFFCCIHFSFISNETIKKKNRWLNFRSIPRFIETYCENELIAEEGVKVVNIAFSDYSFGAAPLFDKEFIEQMHAQGGKVKLSFGGPDHHMQTFIDTKEDALLFAYFVGRVVLQNGLDGVDFYLENDPTSAEIQLEVLALTRAVLGPSKLITFTVPADIPAECAQVLSEGHKYLNTITVRSSSIKDAKMDLENCSDLGIRNTKIVCGIPLTSTSKEAKDLAKHVSMKHFAGVMVQNGDKSLIDTIKSAL